MSSFVTEILVNAAKLEKENFLEHLDRLSKHIREVKIEVDELLQKKYGDFDAMFLRAADLQERVNQATKEMEEISSRIENEVKNQLNVSTAEFEKLCMQLEESKLALNITEQLILSDKCLDEMNNALAQKQYTTAARSYSTLSTLVGNEKSKADHDIQIMKTLYNSLPKQEALLHCDITSSWSDLVKWKVPDTNVDTDKRVTVLTIMTSKTWREQLINTASAMHICSLLSQTIVQFGQKLVSHVLKPILQGASVKCVKQAIGDSCELCIHHSSKCTADVSEKVANITQVLKFLHDCGFNDKLSVDTDSNSGLGVTLMSELGCIVEEEVVNLVLSECISHTVPSSHEELNSYGTTAKLVYDLQKSLISYKLLHPNNKVLSDYVDNIDALFVSKQCKDILIETKNLMQTEMHNMVKVSIGKPSANLEPLVREGSKAAGNKSSKEGNQGKSTPASNLATNNSCKVDDDVFHFPTCYVSAWTQNLLGVVNSHIAQVDPSNEAHTTQLFFTIRQVFELYCDVVPNYHRNNIEDLPQVAALHYNNCMYIAHHLLTLGHQINHLMTSSSLHHTSTTFVDLMCAIRELGEDSFRKQLIKQRDNIQHALTSANGFSNVSEDNNNEVAERAIKQALHQIQLLTKVWHNILPDAIYYKAIGTLVNSLLVELMNAVISLEDISATDAAQLHSLFTLVLDNIQQYYQQSLKEDNDKQSSGGSGGGSGAQVQLEMHNSITKLGKYREVMKVLNGNLRYITEQWADGKGVLAHEVTSTELKQLIRALFQNTDRRAAVLAKIR